MAKYYGNIVYGIPTEVTKGVWKPTIKKVQVIGDISDERWRRNYSSNGNDDITASVSISIIADQFVTNHCSDILYVEYMGSKWKVSEITPKYPRIILSLGGLYNGND